MTASSRTVAAATPPVDDGAAPAAAAAPPAPAAAFTPSATLVLDGPPAAAATGVLTPGGPFEFVKRLMAELASGDLKVPSFPDVAQRVRRVLNDERATQAQIAQVVGSDAALAARVIRIANSSTFNPGGQPITELPTAIARVGHELVRCAATSFALAQMRAAVRAPELRPQLQEAWRQSTLVAAIAYVLARETRAANPDAALVAGVLHNVGRVFIVSRTHLRVVEYAAPEVWEEVLQDWHPEVGRTILRDWKFPEALADAIATQNAWTAAAGDGLKTVLVCAIALVPCVWDRDLLESTVGRVPAFEALGLDAARCRRFLGETAEQIKQLREALAG